MFYANNSAINKPLSFAKGGFLGRNNLGQLLLNDIGCYIFYLKTTLGIHSNAPSCVLSIFFFRFY